LDKDTKQLGEYEPEFVRNLKGLAENECEFQLSKKRLAEAEYAIQFSEMPPRRERVLDRWTLDRWTEHGTQNTSSVKEMTSSFRSILQ
jgi:hypothetical protein